MEIQLLYFDILISVVIQAGNIHSTRSTRGQLVIKYLSIKNHSTPFFLVYMQAARSRVSGRDTATELANYCGPVRARPQHRELRALLFTNSVWVLSRPTVILQQGLRDGTSSL